jgi:phosphate transport system substrate-binding protein
MRKTGLMTWAMGVLAAGVAGWAAPAGAATVRLHGATTVIDRVVNPGRYAVEKATGHTLDVVGNATGKGLVDLHENRCDAALVSEPMEIAAKAAKAAGRAVDASKLQFAVVANDLIDFVVHPSNPVKSLTWDQLRDIHTGKIRNWKEVGGKDQPITVYADTPTGGTRAMIRASVMDGQEYASSVVSLTAVKKVADMVAADPTGVGGLGHGFVDSRVRAVETKKLERPLGFVTIGAPSAAVKAVIDAYKAAEAKKR